MGSIKTGRILELDVLRGFAALAVVILHFTMNGNALKLGWQFRYGITGVDIFFMISGFVIYMSILHTKGPRHFVVNRFARLYPTYWVCVLLTSFFVLIYQRESFNLTQVMANLTMFPAYFNIEDLDGAYWTLLVELWFYLWIFILLIGNKVDLVIEYSLILMAGIAAFHLFHNHYQDLYHFIKLKIQIINHFPLFFSGIVFYKIKFNGPKWRYMLYLLASILLACYLHNKGGRSMYHISAWEHYRIIVGYHLVFVLFILNRLQFLINKPFLYLGKISYSLYLLHQYIGSKLIATFENQLSLSIELSIILTLVICILMAAGVNTYIEVPANEYIRKLFNKKSQKVKQFA